MCIWFSRHQRERGETASQGVADEKEQNVTSNCEFSVNFPILSYLSTDIFSKIYEGTPHKSFQTRELLNCGSAILHLTTDIFLPIERVGHKILPFGMCMIVVLESGQKAQIKVKYIYV